MPNYHYLCHNISCREEFQIHQSIKDLPLTKCPNCGNETILRVLYAAQAIIKNEPKTIGLLADHNTQKLGNQGRQELWEKSKEDKEKAKNTALEKLAEKLPSNANISNLPKDTGPLWYRPGTSGPNMKLADLTVTQQKEYIKEGKTP